MQSAFFGKQEKIGSLLVSNGRLQPAQLEQALAQQLDLAVYVPQEADEFLPQPISHLFLKDHPFLLFRRGSRRLSS